MSQFTLSATDIVNILIFVRSGWQPRHKLEVVLNPKRLGRPQVKCVEKHILPYGMLDLPLCWWSEDMTTVQVNVIATRVNLIDHFPVWAVDEVDALIDASVRLVNKVIHMRDMRDTLPKL